MHFDNGVLYFDNFNIHISRNNQGYTITHEEVLGRVTTTPTTNSIDFPYKILLLYYTPSDLVQEMLELGSGLIDFMIQLDDFIDDKDLCNELFDFKIVDDGELFDYL